METAPGAWLLSPAFDGAGNGCSSVRRRRDGLAGLQTSKTSASGLDPEILHGLLYRPSAIREATHGLVPADTHDVLASYHHRLRDARQYIHRQAVTALGTGVIAYVVFVVLGYEAALTLAVLAGVLQFIPVLGPSLVVALLVETVALLVETVSLLSEGMAGDGVEVVAGGPERDEPMERPERDEPMEHPETPEKSPSGPETEG